MVYPEERASSELIQPAGFAALAPEEMSAIEPRYAIRLASVNRSHAQQSEVSRATPIGDSIEIVAESY